MVQCGAADGLIELRLPSDVVAATEQSLSWTLAAAAR
jgi:hypothetical protein